MRTSKSPHDNVHAVFLNSDSSLDVASITVNFFIIPMLGSMSQNLLFGYFFHVM